MRARVQRWGNSLALRIPKSFAEESGIEDGTQVDISLSDGTIVVTPSRAPSYRLDDLLAKITADNVHEETDTGTPVGREVW